MSKDDWATRGKVSTLFTYIDFGANGEILVSQMNYKNQVMNKSEVIKELQNANPKYAPANPDVDPLFIDAHGYCRLVYAFDPKRLNWLFKDDTPFELKPNQKYKPADEFGNVETVTRGDMGERKNPNAICAFFVDDRNTKKDPDLIYYNLEMLVSQDASDPAAHVTAVTIDPSIRNNNG